MKRKKIKRHSPHTRVLVLWVHAANTYVVEAFRSGGAGYVLKDADLMEVLQAIREVSAGRRYLSPLLLRWATAAPFAGPAGRW